MCGRQLIYRLITEGSKASNFDESSLILSQLYYNYVLIMHRGLQAVNDHIITVVAQTETEDGWRPLLALKLLALISICTDHWPRAGHDYIESLLISGS